MKGGHLPTGDHRRGGLGRRGQVPADILTANATLAGEPLRRLLVPDLNWIDRLPPDSTVFPANAIANHMMTCVGRWLTQTGISIPLELAPVIKNRISQSIPDQNQALPSDKWMSKMFQDALVYLSKAGPKKDGQKAIARMNQLLIAGKVSSRDGDLPSPISIGGKRNVSIMRPNRSLWALCTGWGWILVTNFP